MRIESIRIENFRSFEDIIIPFTNYTCLVGANGAGKSTVLTALNTFFRETENVPTDLCQLGEEDFHRKDTNRTIRITVTFCNLNDEAETDFADYARQGKLVISAEASFDEKSGKAEVKQYGQRLGILAFGPFFKAVADNEKVADLKEIYNKLRMDCPEVSEPGTKASMIGALHQYETDHPDQCELIPSNDQFYGFSKGANRLDKHIQWVYVPAVKDPTAEQVEARTSALGQLLARTVRSKTNFDQTVKSLRANMQDQYQELLDQNQHVLDITSQRLQKRLSEWAHPDATLRLQWKQDPDKSVRVEEPWAHILAGEGDFEGELARFGHGLQRSYLLALLQELAGTDDKQGPTLLLACEEPELYQHPPQARHLADVLHELSQHNAQVMVSTHSPLFVSGEGFEDVRMVRRNAKSKNSTVFWMSYKQISTAVADATGKNALTPDAILAKIHQALQPVLNEMFFTRRLILVEGLQDVAYLLTYLNLLDLTGNYRRMGCHIVPANGKSELVRPLIIAKQMEIPTYVIFDADADKPDRNGSSIKHEKDNKALLKLLSRPNEDAMPNVTVWGTGFTMWHSDIGAIVESEIGKEKWARFSVKADERYGHAGGLKKNSLHIGATLAFAWEEGLRSSTLERVCRELLRDGNDVELREREMTVSVSQNSGEAQSASAT